MEDLLTQAEELKCRNKVDKTTRIDLADSLREFKQVSDEAEVILEQKRVQEEEPWKILGQLMDSWDPRKDK